MKNYALTNTRRLFQTSWIFGWQKEAFYISGVILNRMKRDVSRWHDVINHEKRWQ